MRHPFDSIPSGQWPRFFWLLLFLTLLLMAAFQLSGAHLTTDQAPYGVVSFELAGNPTQMHAILQSWDAQTRERAAFGLGLDYLFMPVYAGMLAFACGLAANSLRKRGWPLAGWGNRLAWAVFLAAGLDVIENFALLQVLWSGALTPWSALARLCALPKFGILFLAIVYGLYAGAVSLVVRLSADPHEVVPGDGLP